MAKHPWRFQGDIAYGETDPVVTVFMGKLKPKRDADGDDTDEFEVEQDTLHPVQMKLSELDDALQLADPVKMQAVSTAQRAERIERKRVAEEAAALALEEGEGK